MTSWSPRISLAALVLVAACNRTPEPGIARGEALFSTCASCHGPQGAGNATLAAPAIAGLPKWYLQAQLEAFQKGHRGNTPWDTTGIRMKSVSWSLDLPTDAASVAEYVASLPAPARTTTLTGNTTAGQATYQVCAACHGAAATGNEDVHAPPLAGQSDWYLLAQLRKLKSGQRGTHPADIWGMTMRGQAQMLDDSAMVNVVAYIQTLRATP